MKKDGDLEVWAKQMQDGSRSVVLLNRDTQRKRDCGLLGRYRLSRPTLSASVRDLWRAKDLGQFKGKFSASVATLIRW